MTKSQSIKNMMDEWIKVGDNYNGKDFISFMGYWIAFNAFYNFKSAVQGDSKALNKLNQIFTNELDSCIIYLYSNYESDFRNLDNVCPIHDEQQIPKPDSTFKINNPTFKDISGVLYQIRCNLIHGNKSDSDKRDVEVVSAALPVLREIVKFLNKEFDSF